MHACLIKAEQMQEQLHTQLELLHLYCTRPPTSGDMSVSGRAASCSLHWHFCIR